jgi:hypothetical protein
MFRANNYTVTVLMLMAFTVFMYFVRNRRPLDNNWPLVYWLLVTMFTFYREEDSFYMPIILIGLGAGMLLRFEFMNSLFVRIVKWVEIVIWVYVLYRGFEIILV